MGTNAVGTKQFTNIDVKVEAKEKNLRNCLGNRHKGPNLIVMILDYLESEDKRKDIGENWTIAFHLISGYGVVMLLLVPLLAPHFLAHCINFEFQW